MADWLGIKIGGQSAAKIHVESYGVGSGTDHAEFHSMTDPRDRFNLNTTISGVKTMRQSLAVSSLALALFAAVPLANAATTTSTFQVTATVNANCLASASALGFGTYTPSAAGAVLDATSTISVRCTKGTAFTVALDAGLNAAGNYTNRAMISGTNLLGYQLYTDTARTTVWGDTTGGTSTVSGTGLGMGTSQAVPLTVYGRIPDTPTAAPGSYSDTVTATVTY